MKEKLIHLLGGYTPKDLVDIKNAALALKEDIKNKNEFIEILGEKCRILHEQINTLQKALQEHM